MKYTLIIVAVLLVLALAKPEGGRRPCPRPDNGEKDRKPRPRPADEDENDRRPRPKPRGPSIFARRAHKVVAGEDLNFKFAIASAVEETLDPSKVALLKVSRGHGGPGFSKTDFKIKLKTLNQEEIEEYYEKFKSQIEEKKKGMKGKVSESDPEKESRDGVQDSNKPSLQM